MTDRFAGGSEAIDVLHVDDEPDFLELARTFLERENERFEVRTATSAAEGVDLLADHDVDCVISDYDMPRTDGIEFLQAVRADAPDLPFILFTGKGSEEIASEAISAGVTDYLQKSGGSDQYTVLANRIDNAVQHRRSQEAVARGRERLRSTIDTLPHILYVVDEQGQYVLANAALAEFHGTTVEAIEGAMVTDVLKQPVAEGFLENLEAVLDAGESMSFDGFAAHDADGDRHVFDTRLRPYDWGDSDRNAVLGGRRIITERKTQERELEARAMAMETATDGIAIFDEDLANVYANQAYADLYGYEDPEALSGDSWRACYDDPQLGEFETEVLPTLAETGHWQGEVTRETEDGRRLHLELQFRRVGESHTVCVVGDVTAKLERERELTRYKILTENVTDTIAIVGEDGTVEYVNPALERTLGYEPDGLLGEMIFDYVHPEDRDRVLERFTDLVSSEEDERIERVQFRMRQANGDWSWLESEARSHTDTALEGYVITSRDITKRKERERQLQRQNDLLENFASVVSHDLRNPLNVAESRLRLAMDECDSEHLADIEGALERMERLIDDVLWLAREGRTIGETEPVALGEAVEAAWEFVASSDDEAGFEYASDDAPVRIAADTDRLRQLLENLFRNAIDHAGPNVTVRVEPTADGFAIEDDGPGMPPEAREAVSETGSTSSSDGTGLGLGIVARIARAHGWDIDVSDGRDGGTRVTVSGVEFVEGAR